MLVFRTARFTPPPSLFQLKSDLQKRLQADPSFTPQRFPNAQQAFVAEDL